MAKTLEPILPPYRHSKCALPQQCISLKFLKQQEAYIEALPAGCLSHVVFLHGAKILADDIPTEKVDLLKSLKQQRLAGEVLQVADSDDDDTETAELRRLKKLFRLKQMDDTSEEFKVLMTVFQFVRGLPEEELELLDLMCSPKLCSQPKVARESGGLEVIGIKRAAAAQMTIECTGSPQKTALALVLSHWCVARMRMCIRMRMFVCVRGDVCAHVSTSACTCACTLSIHTSTCTCVQVPLLVWAKGGRHCVTHINLANPIECTAAMGVSAAILTQS